MAGADLGDRTLIDALQPALEALRDSGLDAAVAAAKNGAASTATMQKRVPGARRTSTVKISTA